MTLRSFRFLTKVFGSEPIRVMGETRCGRDKAPVVDVIHDFRLVFMNPAADTKAASEAS
ncbi:hypothetical protein ACFQI7_21375 [Paenibacillus allorhizosphaerae]|uniref:hypothetical protein n=1 Tax=Paenibacillus allorhizosphaerae TaxID=2849866 RepID=UPI001C401D0D|nr:hypothetical protein [Paenibacillus allorhizosphaerae]